MIDYKPIVVVMRDYNSDEQREYVVDGAFWYPSEQTQFEYVYSVKTIGEEYIVFDTRA